MEEMLNGRGCGRRVLERICNSKLIFACCTKRTNVKSISMSEKARLRLDFFLHHYCITFHLSYLATS
jgi:hypothetical protein